MIAQSRPKFQSTRPIRGATLLTKYISSARSHFNPRAPYGARLASSKFATTSSAISIHAPHTGRDDDVCGHGDTWTTFQSTRPIRGATGGRNRTSGARCNFNPRAPYGARLSWCSSVIVSAVISIHAPHTGRDDNRLSDNMLCNDISIHAPHTGRDRYMERQLP